MLFGNYSKFWNFNSQKLVTVSVFALAGFEKRASLGGYFGIG
jgi:hypothetical protein